MTTVSEVNVPRGYGKFPEYLPVFVSKDMRADIDAVREREGGSLADVARRWLEIGRQVELGQDPHSKAARRELRLVETPIAEQRRAAAREE